MSSPIAIDSIKIDGITTSGQWTNSGSNSLYLPVESERGMAGSFVETQAPKIQNDTKYDLTNFLSTLEVVGAEKGLLNGAFQREFADGAYGEPSNVSGGGLTSGPLAWTLSKEMPLACGAAWSSISSPNYAFKEFAVYSGSLYGLDVKNSKVWKWSGSAWQFYSGTGWRATGSNGTIKAVTDSSGLFKCTNYVGTDPAPHGMATGDKIVITGSNKTAMNTTWTITKTGDNDFTLDGSTFASGFSGSCTWVCDALQVPNTGTAQTDTHCVVTELTVINNMLLVGVGTGVTTIKARYTTDGYTWQNYVSAITAADGAQHYCMLPNTTTGGYTVWYSVGNKVKENVANGRQFVLGLSTTDVQRILYFGTYILAIKPEGVYLLGLDRTINVLMEDNETTATNGRFCVLFNGEAFFSWRDKIYHLQAPVTGAQASVLLSEVAILEGLGAKPFYRGVGVGAWVSGDKIWLVYKITTTDTSPKYHYFILGHRGGTYGDDWHPVFLSTSTTDPSSYIASGVALFGNKLFYSLGNDTAGYILTDGEQPLADASSSLFFTKDVGIITGWIDAQRPSLTKFWQQLLYSVKDYSTTGKVKFYYQKWSDSASTWTAVNSSPSTGTLDRTALTIPAESGAQAGITTNKIRFLIQLENNATGSVTGTANSSGLVKITSASHGLSTGHYVTVSGVGGTTEANGTWKITKVDANSFTLDTSTYANAWTSGGSWVINPAHAWYLKTLHATVGTVYPPARQWAFSVLLDFDGVDGQERSISYQSAYDALLGAFSQVAPVKLTMETGNTNVGTIIGKLIPTRDEVVEYENSEQRVQARRVTFTVREWA